MVAKLLNSIKKIFFGYKTPECVGLDIGTTAIKMAELVPNSLRVSNYNIKLIDKNMISQQGVIKDIEELSELINSQWEKFKPRYKYISVAMPYNSIIIRDLVVAKAKNKFEMDSNVKSQLIEELGIEDIDFDYNYIGETEDGQQKINAVVAKKEKIEEYQAMIQMTGIDVAAIDVEPFAIQYLFEILLKKHQIMRDVLLIDIGMSYVKAYLFNNFECIHFTEIPARYFQLFEEFVISQNMDFAINLDGNPGPELFEIFEKNITLPTELNDAVLQDINKLIQVIKSSILVEKKMTIADDFQICLMGGNSLLPGLPETLLDIGCSRVFFADELLRPENNSIPRHNLIRLVTAIALATWGHKIGKN